jgi:putative endonuclease
MTEIINNHTRATTGQLGEQVAANFLKNKNYEILAMNFKNNSGRRLGEIDVIAKDITQNEIVFIEVKTREYSKYKNTLPEENITHQKLRKLNKIATFYLRKHHLVDFAYRFDAISVWLDYTTRIAKIKHIKSL